MHFHTSALTQTPNFVSWHCPRGDQNHIGFSIWSIQQSTDITKKLFIVINVFTLIICFATITKQIILVGKIKIQSETHSFDIWYCSVLVILRQVGSFSSPSTCSFPARILLHGWKHFWQRTTRTRSTRLVSRRSSGATQLTHFNRSLACSSSGNARTLALCSLSTFRSGRIHH